MAVVEQHRLRQVEHIVGDAVDAFVAVAGHIAIGIVGVFLVLVSTILKVHRPGVGKLLALVRHLFQPVAVVGHRKVVNHPVVSNMGRQRGVVHIHAVALKGGHIAVEVVGVSARKVAVVHR